MEKIVSLLTVLVLGLSTSLLVGVQTAKAQHTSDGKGCPLASGIDITSPSNSTYSSSSLTLNITVRGLLSPSIYRYVMTYSVDGKGNTTIPVAATFVPVEATRTYANGTTAAVISIFSYYMISGCVALPELPRGPHRLTVYAEYKRINDENTNWPALILDDNAVCFIVNDGAPPIILNLSLENKTYEQNNLPLNFTTDKQTSWIGYCLDGKTNVTTTGNTTLTGIANGLHNLTVYANDTVGNMGSSGTITFSVSQPTTLRAEFIHAGAGVTTIAVIVAVALGLKRRS